ncbi:MAG: hypothetical protein V3T31_03100 [candidate division Zixibacteria bacterium]
MKKIFVPLILIAFLPIMAVAGNVAIVNNNSGGGTAEDSLTITFVVTDSIANLGNADSFYVALFNPKGDSVFAGSYVSSASEIDSILISGRTLYRWTKGIADIDGAGVIGTYTGCVIAVDTLSGTSSDYLEGVAFFSFILEPTIGTDIVSVSGSGEAADSLEAGLTGYADADLTNREYIKFIDGDVYQLNGWGPSTDPVIAADTNASGDTLARLDDSVAFRSGIDSGDVAGWVWNSPQVNHTTAGTFGNYLDANISGLSIGSGAYSYTLTVVDSSISQVVPSVSVAIRNLTQSALIASARTGTDGSLSVNLDADSFTVVASATGYVFEGFDTLVVTGTGSDTVFATSFDPGTPSDPSLCRLYGHLYSIEGVAMSGATIRAGLPHGVVRSGNRVVSPSVVSSTSDSTGYFYLDLIPSDSLVPSSAKYEITVSQGAISILRQRLTVPTTTSWRLSW